MGDFFYPPIPMKVRCLSFGFNPVQRNEWKREYLIICNNNYHYLFLTFSLPAGIIEIYFTISVSEIHGRS